MKTILFLTTISLLFFLGACKSHQFRIVKSKKIIPNKNQAKLIRFKQITLAIESDIKYIQDSIHKVEGSALQNINKSKTNVVCFYSRK